MPPLRVEPAGYKIACRVNPRGKGRASRREALVIAQRNEELARQADMAPLAHAKAKRPKAIERPRGGRAPCLFIHQILVKRRLRAMAKKASGEAATPFDTASCVARFRRGG